MSGYGSYESTWARGTVMDSYRAERPRAPRAVDVVAGAALHASMMEQFGPKTDQVEGVVEGAALTDTVETGFEQVA